MTEIQNESLDDFLAHYGVKGMRWGVRRSDEQLDKARSERSIAKEDSADAAQARAVAEKIKSKGGRTNTISNQEMQLLINRMNLERNYNSLIENNKKDSNIDTGFKIWEKVVKRGDLARKTFKLVVPIVTAIQLRNAKIVEKALQSWDYKKDVVG